MIRIEFNKKIRDDIKHLSELVNSNNIREYKIAFDAFNQMYFTNGIIDMLSEIYKKNTNRSNYGNMKQLKEDLFKKNILVTPQPRQSSRRTRSQQPTQPKTQSQSGSWFGVLLTIFLLCDERRECTLMCHFVKFILRSMYCDLHCSR